MTSAPGPRSPSKDPRKQSLYLPVAIVAEMRAEAERQDRAISWIAQQAWTLAKARVRQLRAPEL